MGGDEKRTRDVTKSFLSVLIIESKSSWDRLGLTTS